MKKQFIFATSILLVTGVSSYGSTTPFAEGFEGFGIGGEISGTSDWLTTDVDSGAGVTERALGSSIANSGSRGACITNADLSNSFTNNQSSIFGTFYARPFFGPAPDIPPDSSVAFYVNESGIVVAYSNTTALTLSHTAISLNTYVKFVVSAAYGSSTYNLFLDGTQIATDFAFYSSSNSDFNAFQVRADSGTNGAYLDDVAFETTSPFFQIVSNPVAGPSQVTLYIGDASPGGTYKILNRDDDESTFSLLTTAVNSGGADPFPINDPDFSTDSAAVRVYKVVNASGNESTNDTEWIANKQTRGSNQWHMASLPGEFGSTNENTLNNDLGAELAKILAGNPTEALAPLVWIYEGGWNSYWMDESDIFHPAADTITASNRVEPGEGVWVKTMPQAPGVAFLTGQAHTSSVPISMPNNTWVLFSWPFPSPEANSVAGWGFSNTFTAGTTWNNSSRIFMEDNNTFYNLYLSSADGLWKIQNTTSTAPVSLRPGRAYYFYNAGATALYTAAPAN